MKTALASLLLLLSLGACSFHEPVPIASRSGDTGPPALHAVHDQTLRTLMGRLDRLMLERFQTEPALEGERRQYAQRLARVATEMAQTVPAVRARLAFLALDEGEKATFRALADKLQAQALDLAAQARVGRLEVVAVTLERLTATCTACHALFRQPQQEGES